jgi:hypothetical protein
MLRHTSTGSEETSRHEVAVIAVEGVDREAEPDGN